MPDVFVVYAYAIDDHHVLCVEQTPVQHIVDGSCRSGKPWRNFHETLHSQIFVQARGSAVLHEAVLFAAARQIHCDRQVAVIGGVLHHTAIQLGMAFVHRIWRNAQGDAVGVDGLRPLFQVAISLLDGVVNQALVDCSCLAIEHTAQTKLLSS